MKQKNRPPDGRPKAFKRFSIWFRCGADVFCRIFQLFWSTIGAVWRTFSFKTAHVAQAYWAWLSRNHAADNRNLLRPDNKARARTSPKAGRLRQVRVLFEFLKCGCAQTPNGGENSASRRYASVGFATSGYLHISPAI